MSEPPPPPHYGPYPGSYPPPPPQPYSGYAPPPIAPRNGLGIAALVIAIIGLVLCWTVIGGVILGVAAVIIGFAARGRVRRDQATNGGVAIAGIVLGFLAIIVSLVFIPIWIGIFNKVGFSNYMDCMQSAGTNQSAQKKCEDTFLNNMQSQFSVTVKPTA
jgi:heme/copper-type cytochrome/quinol oxidase subunit 2